MRGASRRYLATRGLQRRKVNRAAVKGRRQQAELVSLGQVSLDDPNDLDPQPAKTQSLGVATPVDGYPAGRPIEAAAERIARMHEELQIGYFTFTITDGTGVTWPTLEKLVARIKG
jgi:hypothetical protein